MLLKFFFLIDIKFCLKLKLAMQIELMYYANTSFSITTLPL